MISLETITTFILYVVVGGLVFWLLYWLIGYVGLPEPFHKVAKVILAVLAVVFLIGLLVSLVSGRPIFRVGAGLPQTGSICRAS